MPVYLDAILMIVYFALMGFTIARIILDTESSSKTLAYIMLVVFLPVFGIIFYFSFGVNYRHRKLDKRRTLILQELGNNFTEKVKYSSETRQAELRKSVGYFDEISRFVYNLGGEALTVNTTRLLLNGERKFPDVLEALENARQSIHMEYYTWENDQVGNRIKDVLIRKAAEGVQVRVLYDDFGSRKIRKNIVTEFRENGVAVYPVIRVKLIYLANRLNHRDHRKIITIDGRIGYIGGINISDRYDNCIPTGLYWRDTHLRIEGPAVLYLQRHFASTWNDCQENWLTVTGEHFPQDFEPETGTDLVQIVAGGPIFRFSAIMLTYMKIFNDARTRLFITNPYFIPNESVLNTLKQSSLSGVDVRLLLPDRSDSMLVGAASRFYFQGLLEAGVRIYLYQKGFVHAKTVVADGALAVVGTANMDNRSFDLNFEIMAVSFGRTLAGELEEAFYRDLEHARELNLGDWQRLPLYKRIIHALARLISSLL